MVYFVCILFADILTRMLSIKGKYFVTELLSTRRTLIFLELLSLSLSTSVLPHTFSDPFRELNLQTNL